MTNVEMLCERAIHRFPSPEEFIRLRVVKKRRIRVLANPVVTIEIDVLIQWERVWDVIRPAEKTTRERTPR